MAKTHLRKRDSLSFQRLGHKTSYRGRRPSVHGTHHVDHSYSQTVAGIHPGVDSRRRRTQQVPIQSKNVSVHYNYFENRFLLPCIIDFAGDGSTRWCGKIKPHHFELYDAGGNVAAILRKDGVLPGRILGVLFGALFVHV